MTTRHCADGYDFGEAQRGMTMSKPYIRSHDGATMVEVAPHEYVNIQILRLQGHLTDGHQHGETVAKSARRAIAV